MRFNWIGLSKISYIILQFIQLNETPFFVNLGTTSHMFFTNDFIFGLDCVQQSLFEPGPTLETCPSILTFYNINSCDKSETKPIETIEKHNFSKLNCISHPLSLYIYIYIYTVYGFILDWIHQAHFQFCFDIDIFKLSKYQYFFRNYDNCINRI